MSQNGCWQSFGVCAIRVTRLAADGTPLTGASDGYLAKAPVMVKLTPDRQAGVELSIMTGCGILGAYFKAPDQLKKYNVTFDLTDLDNELIEILTDEPKVQVEATTVGHKSRQVGVCEEGTRNGVAVEFWSKVWEACSPPAGGVLYWHWFWPRAFLQTGEVLLENNFAIIPIEGYLQANPNFGQGSWSDGQWPEEAGLDRLYGVVQDDFFPTAACGYSAVT